MNKNASADVSSKVFASLFLSKTKKSSLKKFTSLLFHIYYLLHIVTHLEREILAYIVFFKYFKLSLFYFYTGSQCEKGTLLVLQWILATIFTLICHCWRFSHLLKEGKGTSSQAVIHFYIHVTTLVTD